MINLRIGNPNTKPCQRCLNHIKKHVHITKIGYFEDGVFYVRNVGEIKSRYSPFQKIFGHTCS